MLKNFIKQAPLVLIYIIIGFLPLVFSFFVPINNVFELVKSSFFYFSLGLLLSLTLIKSFYFGWQLISLKNLIYKKNLLALFVSLLVFLIYLLFSSFFVAENVKLSIFGSYQRQQGLLFYFSSFVFFLLVLYNFLINKDNKKIDNIFSVITVSGFLVAIIGILQYFGLDPYVWQEGLLGERIISSLGQPNNLGAFLLFSLTSSFIILNSNRRKYLTIVAIYFQIFALYLSGSKSAWLGFILALLVYLFFKLKEKLSLKKLLIYSLSLLIVLSFLLNSRFTNFLNSGSSFLRISFYQTSISSLIDRPLFAYGLEHTDKALIKGYRADWALYLQVNDYPDRAHNIVLQLLLNYGFLGFLILIILSYFLFRYFVLIKKKIGDKELILVLGLLSYFVFLLFNFASITSHLYFWMFLALLFRYSLVGELNFRKLEMRKILVYPISLCLLMLVFFCYNYSASKLSADRLFYLCKKSNKLDICFKAIDRTKSISARNYYRAYTYSNLVDKYLSYPERLRPLLLEGISDYYNNLNSNDYHLWFKLACFLAREESNVIFEKVKTENSKRPLIYQTKADCHLRKGEFELASQAYLRALNLLPKDYQEGASLRFVNYLKFYQHWLYYSLAQSYFAQSKYDLAIDNYRLSFYYYPHSQAVWLNLVKTLELNNQADLAVKELLWAQKYWPNEQSWSKYLSKYNYK